MRSFTSDNLARRPLSKATRHDGSPKSLYDHANRYFISFVGFAVDRDLLPSGKTENQGDRQVLAQLIEIIEPDQAGRLSRELLEEFGSIGRMLGESEAALYRILGSKTAVIKLLKATEKIVQELDHRFLNELPPFETIGPSSENIARYIYRSLSRDLQQEGVKVSGVTAWESESACATYREP